MKTEEKSVTCKFFLGEKHRCSGWNRNYKMSLQGSCLTSLPFVLLQKVTSYVSQFVPGLNGQKDITLMLYVTEHGSHQWLINQSQHKCIYIETALSSRTKLSCMLRKTKVNFRKENWCICQFTYLFSCCWYEGISCNKI